MNLSPVNPILVVSTGRTGTRFIASLLNQFCPGVEAHHTTPWSTLINVLGNMHLARLLSEQALLRVWRNLKGRDFAVSEQSLFVDSNNHLYVFAAYAHQLYAHAKIVHVIRDPRTYVRSHLNWARERPKSFVANYLLPFWQPNGYLLGEFTFGQWLRLDRFERFCWIWDFKNRYLARLRDADLPYLLIRFEDLTENSHRQQTMDTLGEFIGVSLADISEPDSLPSLPRNNTSSRAFPDWRHWSEKQCKQLHQICGQQMSLYGYGLETEWSDTIAGPV